MRGDTEAVRALLRDGADVNAAQGDGMTALHWTALNGDLKTMNVLLYAGAATEPLTRVGRYTPLHLASSQRTRRRGRASARRRQQAGAVTATGVQPLHLAAQAGNADAVTALLDRGADVNAQDETHGRTPLVFAASQNRLEAMKVLLAKGADVAARDHRHRLPRALRRRQSGRAQARDRIVAATTGRATNSNININDPPPTGRRRPQGRAGGRPRRSRRPRRGGARSDGGGTRRRGGGGRAVRAPSDIEQIGRQGGFTALHYAARDGFADAAMLLLDAGMDINMPTEGDRSTPMLVAIINGQYDLAMAFLERGANPEPGERRRRGAAVRGAQQRVGAAHVVSAAHGRRAAAASHLELMEALLKAGADPNARTLSHIWYAAYNTGRMGVEFTGATPFWRAAYALDVEAMRLLVRYGADPNIPTMSFGARGAAERSVGPARDRRPAARTCRRSTRRAASATARRASPSSTATCPTAGCRRRSTSSKSWASTSTCATPTASRRCITPRRAATTR